MKLFRKFWKAGDRVKAVTHEYRDDLNAIARRYGLPELTGQENVPGYFDKALKIIATDAGVHKMPHPLGGSRGT